MKKHIVVIGGGLAGTAAAHSLTGKGYRVTIVEKNNYLGGRIHTELVENTAIEMGAGFMTKSYTNLYDFLSSNGLDLKVYRHRGSSGILRNGKVSMMTFRMLVSKSVLSWKARLHILPLFFQVMVYWRDIDFHALWRLDKYDNRSVTDMFATSAGKEFLEYVLQPTLNGYFYWSPEHTSKAMALVMGKAALLHGTYKIKSGLQRIPETAAAGSAVRLECVVKQIQDHGDDSYTINLEEKGQKQVLKADGIVCATTASAVPNIFPDLTEKQRVFFKSVQYSSTVMVAQAYKQQRAQSNKNIAFPRTENSNLASVTVSSEPETTLTILKAYASGTIGKDLCTKQRETVIRILTESAKPVYEVARMGKPRPLATNVQYWPEALPLFGVGHLKQLRIFNEGGIEDLNQAIVFAGDYIGGPFMEGAFTSGVQAAERLDERLANSPAST